MIRRGRRNGERGTTPSRRRVLFGSTFLPPDGRRTLHGVTLLERVNSPADLKALSPEETAAYVDELRAFLIQ